MAEDETEPTVGHSESHADHVTKKELERHIAELRRERVQLKDEMAELHTADKGEREEMKKQIGALSAFIDELEQSERKKDEVKDSKSTIVLPPTDIPPQQPNPTPPSHTSDGA